MNTPVLNKKKENDDKNIILEQKEKLQKKIPFQFPFENEKKHCKVINTFTFTPSSTFSSRQNNRHIKKEYVRNKDKSNSNNLQNNITRQNPNLSHLRIALNNEHAGRNVRIIFSSDKKRKKELKRKKKEQIVTRLKKKRKKEFEKKRKYKEWLNKMIETEKGKGNYYTLPKYLKIKKKSKLKKCIILEREIRKNICSKMINRKKIEELNEDLFYLIRYKKKWCFKRKIFFTIISTRKKRCRSCWWIHYIIYYWKRKSKHQLKDKNAINCEMNNEYSLSLNYKNVNAPTQQEHVKHIVFHKKNGEKRKEVDSANRNSPVRKENMKEKEKEQTNEDIKKEKMRNIMENNPQILDYIKKTQIEKKLYINSYVEQKITEELNTMVKEFLIKLKKSHERYVLKNKKRYYLGLKECYKYICIDMPKLVIIAPNIEPLQSNMLNITIEKIVKKCKEKDIPLIYALSRNSLGKCVSTCRQAIVCIVDVDSFLTEYDTIIQLAKSLRIQK